jgi:hypothetical protein
MRAFQETLAVGVVMSVVFGCATPGIGAGGARGQYVDAVRQTLSLVENTLPYNGYGEIDIVDDGCLVIKVGGEVYIDPETEEFTVHKSDTLVFQLDTSDLTIVEDGESVFLDKEGVQLAERGLSWDDVAYTAFPEQIEKDRAQARYALETFIGDMDLAFNQAKGTLTVSIIDTHDRGGTFDLTAPILTRVGAGKRTVSSRPEKPGDPQITLNPPPEQSQCSATCSKGSCEITCQGMACTAYCRRNGFPVCECVSSN